MNDLQESLLQSIEILAENTSNKIPNTQVIECRIQKVVDLGVGLYTVQYLENSFNAHTNSNAYYSVGEKVYVLVPNGDFSKEKIILGTAAAVSVVSTETSGENYLDISGNLFGSVGNVNIEMSSFYSETINITGLDQNNFKMQFEEYLKDSKDFVISAKIRTIIPQEQGVLGNYGLIVTIPVYELDENKQEIKRNLYYTVDTSNISGDPHHLNDWSPQNIYFTFPDNIFFDASEDISVSAFVENYPMAADNSTILDDIFIKDLSFKFVEKIADANKSGYYLSLGTDSGTLFFKDVDKKKLTPTLRINNKDTKMDSSNSQCYWFVEDSGVGLYSTEYTKIGGIGWRCLNEKDNITIDENGNEIFNYITDTYSLDVLRDDVISELRYKCVVNYNGNQVQDTITLKNLSSNITVALYTKNGNNVFIKDVGKVHLICKVGKFDEATLLKYDWVRLDKNGNAINGIMNLVEEKTEVTNGKYIYSVEVEFPVKDIDTLNTIQCTVSMLNAAGVRKIIGTKQLGVTTTKESGFTLLVDNDEVLYKYDTNGNSPFTANYDGPEQSTDKVIKPLTYRIFKPSGEELDEEEYKYCKAVWAIPKNSLIQLVSSPSEEKSDDNYYRVEADTVSYKISNIYSALKKDGAIMLEVDFNGLVLKDKANIIFMKEGEGGTNGTRYAAVVKCDGAAYEEMRNGKICKLIPVFSNGAWIWTGTPSPTAANFSVDLYKDGELVTNTSIYSVSWGMFDERVTNPCFAFNGNRLIVSKAWFDDTCNIVQATIKINDGSETNSSEVLYAYYPIEVCNSSSTSLVSTIEGGFSSVLYASDGTNPKYSSQDFVAKNNLGISPYSVTWSANGNLTRGTTTDNVARFTPKSKFDSGNSKNYVKAVMTATNPSTTELVNERNSLNTHKTKIINEKNNLITYISTWRYSDWLSNLNNAKSFLNQRALCLQDLEQLYKKLREIENYGNDISSIVTQLDNSKNLLYNLGKNELSTIVVININLNSFKGKDKKVDLLIDDFKRIESQYNSNLNTLKTITASFNSYKQFINNINSLNSTVLNTIIAQNITLAFVEIQKLLIKLYNNLFDSNVGWFSYNDIKKNILDGSIDLFSSYVFVSGNTATLTDYMNNFYSTVLEEIELQLATINQQIANLDKSKDISLIHIKPIVMIYNRYEMSALNGWDGNKLYTDDDGTYILAPQMGAGKKESDNSFTGLVMGVKRQGSADSIGLFGMSHGTQTIFLDADTGKAEFGKSGGGQILLDPSKDEAIIKSGNYSTTNKTGMQINLTAPTIEFGSGKFKVASNGNLTANDAHLENAYVEGEIESEKGHIGGWDINFDGLFSPGCEYDYDDDGNIIVLDGIAIDSYGKSILSKTWEIRNGDAYFSNVTITGRNSKLTMSDGEKSTAVINGDGSAMFSNIQIIGGGANSNTSFNINNGKFIVDSDGNLSTAGSASIQGTLDVGNGSLTFDNNNDEEKYKLTVKGRIESKEGSIGGWIINKDSLMSSDGNIQINSALGGAINANSLNGVWSINGDGSANFSNVTITGGRLEIGGEEIDEETGQPILVASINNEGVASFRKIHISGTGNTIASFKTDNNSIYSGVWAKPKAPDVFMSSGTKPENEYTIGGHTGSGWVFGAGDKFGVKKDGTVYCSDIKITGGGIFLETTNEDDKILEVGTASGDMYTRIYPAGVRIVREAASGILYYGYYYANRIEITNSGGNSASGIRQNGSFFSKSRTGVSEEIEFIDKKDGKHTITITGGIITNYDYEPKASGGEGEEGDSEILN